MSATKVPGASEEVGSEDEAEDGSEDEAEDGGRGGASAFRRGVILARSPADRAAGDIQRVCRTLQSTVAEQQAILYDLQDRLSRRLEALEAAQRSASRPLAVLAWLDQFVGSVRKSAPPTPVLLGLVVAALLLGWILRGTRPAPPRPVVAAGSYAPLS